MRHRFRLRVLSCGLWVASGVAAAGAIGCDRPLGGGATDAGAADADAACPTTATSPFVACGCGCCGPPAAALTCYYPARGESPATIDPPRTPESCATAGCWLGARYLCCASPAPPTSESASYCAYDLATNIERYEVLKTDGTTCTRFLLEGLTTNSGFPVSAPASFEVSGGTRGPCQSSAVGVQAVGAIGTVAFHAGPTRALDIHLTLFFDTGSGTAEAVRFDAEALSIDSSLCD